MSEFQETSEENIEEIDSQEEDVDLSDMDLGDEGEEETQTDEENTDEENNDEENEEETIEDLLDEANLDKKVRVKINGEEKVLTIRELQKVKQLEEASYDRMKQAAEDKKMAKKLFDLAQADPMKFLELTGQDPFEFAEATLSQKIEMAKMSPEAREAMKLKRENENLRSDKERRESDERSRRQQEETQREFAELQKEVNGVLEDLKLPNEQMFTAGIAQTMIADRDQKVRTAMEQGLDPRSIPKSEFLTAKEAGDIVKRNFLTGVTNVFEQMSGEEILESLGKDALKKIQKANVKRVSRKKTSPKFSKPSPGNPASSKKESNNEESYQEWVNKLMNS